VSAQHTPGPWRVTKIDGRYAAFEIQPASTRNRNRALGNGDAASRGEVEAVRRLIEHTPYLLAALEEIVKSDPYNQSSAGTIARAAIAKATGSES
jgi:hypothetical protein